MLLHQRDDGIFHRLRVGLGRERIRQGQGHDFELGRRRFRQCGRVRVPGVG
jgi:hypothetical protein